MRSAETTAVVTDSTADIPRDAAAENGILVIPAMLIVDGVSYEDGEGLSRAEFYRRMPAMRTPPSTASPPLEVFLQTYRTAFERGANQIVSIHVASQLSGIAELALQAARSFQDRVHVVDSGQVSLGIGFQVLRAARAAAQGLSAAEVVAAAATVRHRVRTLAMIDNLEYLRRSGRVDWLRSSLSSLLHIRLLVELKEGAVHRLAQVRTRRKAIEALVLRATAWGPLQHLGVLHSEAGDDAVDLARSLEPQVSGDRPHVVDVTTVIGTHVGPQCLGLVGVLQNPGG